MGRTRLAALSFVPLFAWTVGCGRVRFEPSPDPPTDAGSSEAGPSGRTDGGRRDGSLPRDAAAGDSGASGESDAGVPPALACADAFLGSAIGTAVATGSTTGRGDDSLLCNGDGAPDVTYGWIAPSSGRYRVSLCRSAYDTILSVYDGGCGGPMLACDDDACATNFGSAVNLDLVAGQAVVFVIDGLYEEGAFQIDIELRSPSP